MPREKRGAPKSQAAIVRQLMELPLKSGEGAEELEALGLDPTWGTEANVAVMNKARKGDVTSLRYLRDTMGEEKEETDTAQPVAEMDLSRFTDAQLRAMLMERQQEGSDGE